ncbi:hypothetical protein DRN98_09750 [Methanosarcinales archaeon]|nr:hypothetical protein [Deltaproteobacteria bacterium]RLA89674.1 MAG: hypothetical protein DRG20_04355 [Deltaproteobacteria bacterium]RLG28303.1 MAG: hypothetical protein DRN98_09750 [Methanosarcinales archaeon]
MKGKKEKRRYEPPTVIDLTAKDKAQGDCLNGSVAYGICTSGYFYGNCNPGGNDVCSPGTGATQ